MLGLSHALFTRRRSQINRSTGPIPTEDLVIAIIDDGSSPELVDAAFLGAAASGAKAVSKPDQFLHSSKCNDRKFRN